MSIASQIVTAPKSPPPAPAAKSIAERMADDMRVMRAAGPFTAEEFLEAHGWTAEEFSAHGAAAAARARAAWRGEDRT